MCVQLCVFTSVQVWHIWAFIYECVCKCVSMCVPKCTPNRGAATSPGQPCVTAGCGPDVGVALTEKEPGCRPVLGTIWIWALGGQGLLPDALQQLEFKRAQAE